MRIDARFNYWRTNSGSEVDLVISRSSHDSPLAIEIKSGPSPDSTDLTGLHSFQEDNPKARLVCICQTEKRYTRNKIEFIPWQDLPKIAEEINTK